MPPVYCPIQISIKRKFLLLVLSLLAAFLRLFRARGRVASKAIVIEPFGMGDAISILPMVEQLSGCFDEITVVTKPAWSRLFTANPKTKTFEANLPWSNYSTASKYSFTAYTQRPLRNLLANIWPFAGGAVGFDPRGDIRSILFLYIAGCSKVYTLDHYLGTNAKIPNWAARTQKIDQNQQRWRIACELVAAAGYGKAHSTPPAIHNGKSNLRTIKNIAFLPVAPWPGRLWPKENWHELLSRVRAQGFAVQGICGPKQKQQTHEMLGIEEITECTTIDSWIKSLSEIDLLVTLDSGPMHLADAVGVPLIALFGPGQLPMWAPTGKFSRVLHHQDPFHFRPIHQIEGNEKLGEALMGKITVKEVWDSIQKLVDDLKFSHSGIHAKGAKRLGEPV
jgi:ADP-heptose:LPS heptosyltransferase